MAQGSGYNIVSPFGTFSGGTVTNLVVTGAVTVTGSINTADSINAVMVTATVVQGNFIQVEDGMTVVNLVDAGSVRTGTLTLTGTVFANGGAVMGLREAVNAIAAATTTLSATDAGEIFTNDSFGAQVNLVLPTAPSLGTSFVFVNTSATQNLKVAAAGSDKFWGISTGNKSFLTSNAQYHVCKISYIFANVWLVVFNTGFTAS